MVLLSKMSARDIQAIKKVAPHYMHMNIDLLGALTILRKYNTINERQYKTLVQKYSTDVGSGQFVSFVWDVVDLVSFQEFIQFLHKVNCGNFADELQVERFHRQVYWVEGRHVRGGSKVVQHYSMMKRLCDDNMLHDRKNDILTFAARKKNEMKNLAEKQLASDQYATLMQLCTTFHPNDKTKEEIIVEMKNSIPPDLDSTYSDILYHSNLGVACAQNGNEAGALVQIRKVNTLGFKVTASYIQMFSYYYLHYIYRCLYSKNPCQENLKNAQELCHLGLDVLTCMNQSDIQLIQRVFLLNLTQTLLGIRDDFSIDHSIQIDDSNLFVAQQHLNKVEKNFNRIESRREMIYCLCKVRTLQDTDLFLAQTYLDRALALSHEGAYLETNVSNITMYQNWLLLRELPYDLSDPTYIT